MAMLGKGLTIAPGGGGIVSIVGGGEMCLFGPLWCRRTSFSGFRLFLVEYGSFAQAGLRSTFVVARTGYSVPSLALAYPFPLLCSVLVFLCKTGFSLNVALPPTPPALSLGPGPPIHSNGGPLRLSPPRYIFYLRPQLSFDWEGRVVPRRCSFFAPPLPRCFQRAKTCHKSLFLPFQNCLRFCAPLFWGLGDLTF